MSASGAHERQRQQEVRGEGLKGFRGPLLHFLGDPLTNEPEKNYEYLEDGLLVVSPDGIVVACLEASAGIERYGGDLELVDCSGKVRWRQVPRGGECSDGGAALRAGQESISRTVFAIDVYGMLTLRARAAYLARLRRLPRALPAS